MKIFWSWQSDHDGKISHYFVRDALSDAIKTIKASSVLEEPSEADRRAQLHLDHDTKGKTGWVDITQSIFEKIENAAVFVADVTPVVVSSSKIDADGKEIGIRPIMNPNVAIELGYALKALDWSKIIPVMNSAYGSVERMPFDIDRTRRWAIQYELKEGASNVEITEARKTLATKFVAALKEYVAAEPEAVTFRAIEPKSPPGLFFNDTDILAVRRNDPFYQGKELNFKFTGRTYAYLRVIPTVPLGIPLSEQLLKSTIGRHGAFGLFGTFIQENGYGVAFSNPNPSKLELDSLTQYFRNGEIWGVSADIVQQTSNEYWVNAAPLENNFITSLQLYLEFMERHSHVAPPVTVEAGIVGVKDMRLVYKANLENLGKMYEPDVIHRSIFPDFLQTTGDQFLRRFFEKVHNNSGVPRPSNLNGRW